MPAVSDETLMAYADGELPMEDCRELEAMLAIDAHLRARLEPFTLTGAALADVFEQPMHEPVPDRLLAVVRARRGVVAPQAARSGTRNAPSRGFLTAIADAMLPNGLSLEGAFAATILVLAGGLGGWMLAAGDGMNTSPQTALATFQDGDLVASGPLKVALDTQTSDTAANVDSAGRPITLVQSFQSRDKQFCREFAIGNGGDSYVNGLACHVGASGWRIVAHGKAEAAGDDQSGQYHSAGIPSSPAVSGAVDTLKTGLSLDVEVEETLIANHWMSPSK